jgi:hypothetical protein
VLVLRERDRAYSELRQHLRGDSIIAAQSQGWHTDVDLESASSRLNQLGRYASPLGATATTVTVLAWSLMR